MKPLLISLVILIGSSCKIYGQKEASNWYFGFGGGITFKNGPPVALTDGAINQSEGVATISDANGNLLFYTDGNKVWNRNHIIMPNGSFLNGDNQSAQSAVIVPMPNDPDIYYIFTVSNWPTTGPNAGLFYSIVNMRLDGGLGNITTKNFLLNANPREQVSAAFHENCRDVWIVSHEKGASNNYLSYLLSPTGVSVAPVISPVGMNYNGGNRYGYLRFSPDGNKLCSTLGYAITGASTVLTVQLLDFDKATGIISNPITLADANFMRDAYSSEFSSDNSKLYVTAYTSRFIYQYDLSSGNPATIAGSAVNVAAGSEEKTCVQMGPDKKIYVSKSNKSYLSVIENPNQRGVACNYIDDAINLGTGKAALGLPNFIPGFFARPNLGADRGICTGGTMVLNAYTKPGDTYLWQDGSNTPAFNVTAPGTYWVEITSGSCIKRDEVNIIAGMPPVIDLGPDRDICGFTSYKLNAYIPDATYLWQNGSTAPIFSANGPGTYSVTVELYGCVGTDAVTVTAIAPPTVDLGRDTLVCGPPNILTLDAGNAPGNKYLWSSGATTSSTQVTISSTYTVQVSNTGCTVADGIVVTFGLMPKVDLGPDLDLCTTGPALNFDVTNRASAVYEWQDGTATPKYTVSAPGDYWVKVFDRGCTKSDTIKIGTVAPPRLELGNDTTICSGAELVLNAYDVPGNFYIWQDGNGDSAIKVNTAGIYSVDVYNSGCMVSDMITVNTTSAMAVNLGNDTTLCSPASVTITAPPFATATYEWHNLTTGTNFTTNASGKYWVTVTDNGCRGSDTIYVTSMAPPVVNLGNDTALCNGKTLPLEAYTAPGNNYAWQNGSTTSKYEITAPGKYYVDVTNGCKMTDTIEVTYQPIPTINLGNDTTVCFPAAVTFTAPAAAMYKWQDATSNQTFTTGVTGKYWVTITDNGCDNADTIYVTSMAPPVVDLGNDTALCDGKTLPLDAYRSPGNTYTWQNGNTANSYTVTMPGKYYVDVINTACKTTDTINVTYTSIPVVSLGNDTMLCTSGTIQLTAATSSLLGSYNWQDGLTANAYNVTTPGLYWVAVTENGCVGKDTILVNAMAEINIGRDTSLCVNQTLLLQAVNIPGATYVWQDGTTVPAYRVNRPGTYKVDVTTACGLLSDAIVVREEDCNCRISFPNAFSPDRNFRNDVFKPVIERCNFAEYNFKIFNRWGERIFETNNPLKGWDGLFKGQLSDIGAYVYVVTYRSTIADKKVKHGTLMLVR